MIGDVIFSSKTTNAELVVVEIEHGYRFTVTGGAGAAIGHSESWADFNKWKVINAGKNALRRAERKISRRLQQNRRRRF